MVYRLAVDDRARARAQIANKMVAVDFENQRMRVGNRSFAQRDVGGWTTADQQGARVERRLRAAAHFQHRRSGLWSQWEADRTCRVIELELERANLERISIPQVGFVDAAAIDDDAGPARQVADIQSVVRDDDAGMVAADAAEI